MTKSVRIWMSKELKPTESKFLREGYLPAFQSVIRFGVSQIEFFPRNLKEIIMEDKSKINEVLRVERKEKLLLTISTKY